MKNQVVDININIRVDDNRQPPFRKKVVEQKVKIKTKLSVPQLAYFFRVLFELEKIKSANQTDIMKFIADNFETENVSQISINSLRSKYYNVEEKVKTGTRKQLMEIIQFMDNDHT
jgi:hypothetical protein